MKYAGCFVLVIAALGFSIFGGVFWALEATSLRSDLAQIEQLRHDISLTDPVSAEAAVGQVTKWNQYIVSQQTYNHQWWSGWAVPDEWDHVKLIELPHP